MPIELICPNGHHLTAKESNAGKSGKCPVCKAAVTIPIPKRSLVADSAIVVGLLSDLNAQSTLQVGKTVIASKRQTVASTVRTANSQPRVKVCPNCERDIDLGYHICPHCHAYLAGLNEF